MGLVRLLAALLLLVPAVARAEWKQANSRNFTVYSEGSEQSLREATVKLEKLHFVMRTIQHVTRPPSPLKLRVFLMKNADEVAGTLDIPSDGIQGYYDGGDRGPFLVGTRMAGGSYSGLDPQVVLQHEYAHGFMYEYFPATYPTWYSEGFAEFWGNVRLLPNDVVEIGQPSKDRYASFEGNRWLPLSKILGARSYDDVDDDVDLIYAEGWLLLRYLFDNKPRAGQLQRYLTAINRGTPYEKAMDDAFGPGAKALDDELRHYAGNSKFTVLSLPFKAIDVGPIDIARVSPAQEALMAAEIRVTRGLRAREVQLHLREVASAAARFPDDAYAQTMLAEAQRFAGNQAAAAAAADKALALKADDARALMQKGMAALEALRRSGGANAAQWTDARRPLLAAVQKAPEDPLVLAAFYDSFVVQGVLPPDEAQNTLYHAFELAPSDDELRYEVALDFERRGMIPEAAAVIRPKALAMRLHETEKQRKDRERDEEKYRLAAHPKHERASEMLQRLEAELPARK